MLIFSTQKQQHKRQQMFRILSFRKTLFACIVVTIIFLNGFVATEKTSTTPSNELLEVQLYYEALCPDSVRFIRYQLYDAMIYKNLMNYTDLKLIPYGKVRTWFDPFTNQTYLDCQHGYRECKLNALHACLVEHNEPKEQVLMIDCLMGRYTLEQCASNININITAALHCRATRSVEDILEKYGVETNAIDLWFVPSIGMDGKFSENNQDQLRSQFFKNFCNTYKQKYNVTLESCIGK